MDRLEKFVIQNKESFDTLEPPSHLWEKIQKDDIGKASPNKIIQLPVIKWTVRIAAAVIIFIASYYWHDFQYSQSLLKEKTMAASPLLNEFLEAKYYYTAQIDAETEKFYSITVGNNSLREEIKLELDELDKEFAQLKEDLTDNADNEDVIAAMIQTYRLKLSILQDIMQQLQEQKSEKNSNHETKRINI